MTDEKNKNILLNNQIISLNGQINMYKSQLNEEKNKNQSYINTINGLNSQINLYFCMLMNNLLFPDYLGSEN